MYAIFEDSGKYLGGRILSETGALAVIELDSGKRLKVKDRQLVLRFDHVSVTQMMEQAQAEASQIDLDLAWEFAPSEDFHFAQLARDYFGQHCSLQEQTTMLLRLHQAPHYFRRAGPGNFRKADPETLRQALVAIEKKKLIQQQIDHGANELIQGQCPAGLRLQVYKVLFKPDKNSLEYKTLVQAAQRSQRAPLDLLMQAGAIGSAYQLHLQRFLLEHFPNGTQFPDPIPISAPTPSLAELTADLPLAPVTAYSIDDSETTEIDDALSVQGLGSGCVTLGIHIAAPALGLQPRDALDLLARQRLSTVYMPGYKITMLPDAVVQRFSLAQGQAHPVLSLYVRFSESDLGLLDHRTCLERVTVGANLRHDQLDTGVSPEWLQQPALDWQADTPPPAMPRVELAWLYRLALHLRQGRMQARGKPESGPAADYSFRLQGKAGQASPDGSETVTITPRLRGQPLDLIVAEAMILANQTWGQWLDSLGVPAIYRSQAGLGAGIKVRMGTRALPHAGLGVPCYAWSTSPLRRYTDLVNQWQLITCARHDSTAALVAPFQPKNTELLSIVAAFEETYAAYASQQAQIERFWTLRYLQQNNISSVEGSIIKDGPAPSVLVRVDRLPLVLTATANGLQRGQRVRLKLGRIDELALEVSATLSEVLSEAPGIDPLAASSADSESVAEPLPPVLPLPIGMAITVEPDTSAPADQLAPTH